MLLHCLLLACVLQEALAWTISCSWSRPAVRREARSAAQDLSACAHSAMSRRAALAVSLSFALAPLPTCAESPGSKPDPFAEFNIMGVAGRKAEETVSPHSLVVVNPSRCELLASMACMRADQGARGKAGQ